MADIFSREKRSEIMSGIRSKWTSPEKRAHNMLKGQKIRHKMHPKMTGNPDILIKDGDVAVFIHGCFWHGCPKHFRLPKTNREFWRRKIMMNKKRHNKNRKKLMAEGHAVIEIWEHEL